MLRAMRSTPPSRLATVLLVAALLATGACRKKEQAKPAAAATTTPVAAPQATAVPGSARVVVEMTDHGVVMTGNVQPGPTTFIISNTGHKPHRLAIERGRQTTSLDGAIDPGAEGQIQMTLAPGTYRVYCTFESHKELPLQLVVTARRSY